MSTSVGRVVRVGVVATLFGVLGFLGAALYGFVQKGPIEAYPAPWRIALTPDGTALRLAMVYDVVHQRFPKHGPAWHEAVVERSKARIAQVEATDPAGLFEPDVLDLFDDQAVALDRLHRPAEAIAVMRRKKALVERRWPHIELPPERTDALAAYREMVTRAEQLSPPERAWYRTYANLGTVLIHGGFGGALRGDAEAKAMLVEGLGFVRQAVRLNPGAHFGRERWQVVLGKHLLRAIEDPDWLLRFTALGADLDETPPPSIRPDYRGMWGVEALVTGENTDLESRWATRQDRIPRLVPAPDWAEVTGADAEGAPFDEPVLGVLGMWMLGGGANPHSAAALGDVMERMEQRRIAFAAYARALDLKDRFWPDARIRDTWAQRIEGRMQRIAADLGEPIEALRAEHRAALAEGEAYQQKQAAFEAKLRADGADLLAEGALAPFVAAEGPIASPPGAADTIYVRKGAGHMPAHRLLMWVLLAAALGAWLAVRAVNRRRR
ncbi:MAG: hypothetical protein H6704_23950 [Myxococcales bacterium]|nr:hypothetical protein [Myxococcales bacterium]